MGAVEYRGLVVSRVLSVVIVCLKQYVRCEVPNFEVGTVADPQQFLENLIPSSALLSKGMHVSKRELLEGGG
jgi:hypothetical protein